MRRRTFSNEEGWLLSYADLVTNLLVFFVMLLAAADISRTKMQQIAQNLSGVQSAALVTKEEALERFRTTLGGGELLAGLDENPLPASLEVELTAEARNTEGIADLVAIVGGLDGVDELAHGQEWIEGYARLASMARSCTAGVNASSA